MRHDAKINWKWTGWYYSTERYEKTYFVTMTVMITTCRRKDKNEVSPVVKSIIDEVYQMELGSERYVFRSNFLEEVLGDNFRMLWRLGCRKDPLFTSLLIKKCNSSRKVWKDSICSLSVHEGVGEKNSPDAEKSYSIT